MSYNRITRFNHIAGNTPHLGADYEYWQQIKNQASRVLEEAQELYDAAQAEDMIGVVDGFADVRYTNEYVEDLLIAGEVETKKAWDAVCNNNDQKFTTSYTYACDSKEVLEELDVDCYLDSTTYEGTLYYVIRRVHDNKILKLKHHESPDLSIFVPSEFK